MGGKNWWNLFNDPGLRSSWWLSLIYFVSTVGLELVFGIGIALLVDELIWGRNLILSLLLMPMFIAPAVVTGRIPGSGAASPYLNGSSRGLTWIFCNVRATDGQLANDMVPASITADVFLATVSKQQKYIQIHAE